MNLPEKKTTSPIQSPHAALQAMLPRLRSLGLRNAPTPFFDTQLEVADFLDERTEGEDLSIVPVWAIDHSDLRRSMIVKWTYSPYLH